MTRKNKQTDTPKTALIKSNLKRAFDEQAAQALPPELMALIDRLHAQDSQDKS